MRIRAARKWFSAVVQRALGEKSRVASERGAQGYGVVSAELPRQITGDAVDFTTFLLNAPDLSDLDLQRVGELARRVEL